MHCVRNLQYSLGRLQKAFSEATVSLYFSQKRSMTFILFYKFNASQQLILMFSPPYRGRHPSIFTNKTLVQLVNDTNQSNPKFANQLKTQHTKTNILRISSLHRNVFSILLFALRVFYIIKAKMR